MKLILRDVMDKKILAKGVESTRVNTYWKARKDMNAIVTGKFEFLTAVVTSIQAACFITS